MVNISKVAPQTFEDFRVMVETNFGIITEQMKHIQEFMDNRAETCPQNIKLYSLDASALSIAESIKGLTPIKKSVLDAKAIGSFVIRSIGIIGGLLYLLKSLGTIIIL